METTRVYIADQQDTASIHCPGCQQSTEVSIAALAFKHRLKVKCRCRNIFMVEVEFRDMTRKLVDLAGSYEVAGSEEEIEEKRAGRSWEEILFDQRDPNCRIIDLSREGIGFLAMDRREIKVGDIVEIGFRLDGAAGKKVKQACRVKHVNGAFVGCRMVRENPSIIFYLAGKD